MIKCVYCTVSQANSSITIFKVKKLRLVFINRVLSPLTPTFRFNLHLYSSFTNSNEICSQWNEPVLVVVKEDFDLMGLCRSHTLGVCMTILIRTKLGEDFFFVFTKIIPFGVLFSRLPKSFSTEVIL